MTFASFLKEGLFQTGGNGSSVKAGQVAGRGYGAMLDSSNSSLQGTETGDGSEDSMGLGLLKCGDLCLDPHYPCKAGHGGTCLQCKCSYREMGNGDRDALEAWAS